MYASNVVDFFTYIEQTKSFPILKTIILIVTGFLVARFVSNAITKLASRYASSRQLVIVQKLAYFSILGLFIVTTLQQLGFQLNILLGSAGIITAAIAIASQTSIANVVSGMFLILERSFQIGDRIKVGTTSGIVSSIDLLSVKILTPHNTMVRIPNDSLIKSEITNITRFESRRLDLVFRVRSETDVRDVKTLLLNVATNNPLTLKTPLPSVAIKELDGGEIHLQLSTWVEQKNYDALIDSLYQEVLLSFQQHEIHF